MPTNEEKRRELAQVWASRIDAANRHYDAWEQKFDVKDLEQAYYGFQWDECEGDPIKYKPYVMNMIYSSIDVKMPNLLFTQPVYLIEPKPSQYDFDPSGAKMRARLKEDVLNYFVQGGIEHFTDEIDLCILDAFFRFAILEVGYSADFIQNPDAGKPYLLSDTSIAVDKEGKVIKQPELLVEHERIYVRRIPAERFRVGGVDQSALSRSSWYGYIDFVLKEDLLAAARTNKGYNRTAIENATGYTPDSKSWNNGGLPFYQSEWDSINNADVVAVWKIYDMRAKEHFMFTHDVNDLIYSEPITRIKHFPLKFRNLLKGFLPLPFVYNWTSPQAEVNETREAARIHRRRFQRKYITAKGAFTEEALDKLQNGADGIFVESDRPDITNVAIPLQAPNLTGQHDQAMVVSRDDFNIISGTSAEQRGQSDRTTATQSQIKERRSEIRESRDKNIVAKWLCDIGHEILLTAKERMALPFWVKVSHDTPQLFAEMSAIEDQWKMIMTDDLGDEDFKVNIKVSSLSPLDQQLEKNNMVEFLSLVSQFPQVAMSPTMIQEIADRTGFRNERAIAEFVQSAQLLKTLQVMQLATQSGQDPMQVLMLETFMRNAKPGEQNPVAQRVTAQMTPPDMETIQNQIGNQLSQPQE